MNLNLDVIVLGRAQVLALQVEVDANLGQSFIRGCFRHEAELKS